MIRLRNVSLEYPVVGHFSRSLQREIYTRVGGLIGEKRGGGAQVSALRDIDLEIADGCRLGILGHNGAGKTSLLRTICGVYPPTAGSIETSGRISALTDITLGMDANATGYRNIVFRLVFMGRSFREAEAAAGEIAAFSELGDFIDLPVHTYSAGMYLRLAFAIATHFPPDILVLDEIIGAGDIEFRAKARERMESLLGQSRIVVLSSHDLSSVAKYCTRAIVLDHGRIIADGPADAVAQAYGAGKPLIG
jgi:lipopolysaccharide transport system ATP-binding protein